MDRIIMENMRFYGYHGVLPEEGKLGQKFLVDASLFLPLDKAGKTDDLGFTVDYGAVYATIEKVMTKEQFSLLEALAERICEEIFKTQPAIERIRLKIKKPEAPVPGIFDYIGVEIERERK